MFCLLRASLRRRVYANDGLGVIAVAYGEKMFYSGRTRVLGIQRSCKSQSFPSARWDSGEIAFVSEGLCCRWIVNTGNVFQSTFHSTAFLQEHCSAKENLQRCACPD